MSDLLIIGYGSTLRGDDGVGPAVVEKIQAMSLAGVQTIACHQLTPELADPISRADRIVFVDATIDRPDDSVRIAPVQPEGRHQVMVHTSSPEGLLHLAQSVFGHCPKAWVVAIPVASMGIGEELSEQARIGVDNAVTKIVGLIGK